MNVIVVTHDSIFGRYVAASLARATRIDRVVIETAGAGWRFYARKLRRVGPLNFGFQYVLNRAFRRDGADHLPDLSLPTHERIGSINELAFGDDDLVRDVAEPTARQNASRELNELAVAVGGCGGWHWPLSILIVLCDGEAGMVEPPVSRRSRMRVSRHRRRRSPRAPPSR